jgi:hypothetical protein
MGPDTQDRYFFMSKFDLRRLAKEGDERAEAELERREEKRAAKRAKQAAETPGERSAD